VVALTLPGWSVMTGIELVKLSVAGALVNGSETVGHDHAVGSVVRDLSVGQAQRGVGGSSQDVGVVETH